MIQTCTSTQNEIIRYVYNETSAFENLLIERLISSDDENLEFYLDCLDIKNGLNKISLSPKQFTLDRIMDFSRMYKSA